MTHIVKQLPRRSVWWPVANKLYKGGCQSHAKIACDWWPVAFKLYPSGRQSHANRNLVASSCRQIPIIFYLFWMRLAAMLVQFSCNWGHSGTICMRLAATWLQFEYDWPPVPCFFACDWRPVAWKAASFRKHTCAAHRTFCYFELYSIF